jgi:hypothetical protein
MAETSDLTIVPASATAGSSADDSAGVIDTSGALSVDGGYGVMNMTGGSVTVGSWFALGRGGGQGAVNLAGNSGIIAGTNAGAANSTVNLATAGGAIAHGGTITSNPLITQDNALGNSGPMGPFPFGSQATSGSFTYSGTTTVSGGSLTIAGPVTTSGILNVSGTGALVGNGTLRLKRTGTLDLTSTGSSLINFNGGILQVANGGLSTGNRLLNSSPIITRDIGSGGTGPMGPFLSPPGSAWSTPPGISLGGSFIETPIVQISGGVGGSSAIANVDINGHVTGITIVNPGTTYSPVPTFTLVGNVNSGGTITAVPEPSGLVLGGLAAVAFLVAGRMRRQRD